MSHLSQQRYRTSPQRQAILRAIKFSKMPMSSVALRHMFSKMPPATLYRNIDLLVQRGEIFEIEQKTGGRSYVGQMWHEAEFICVQCGKRRHLKHTSLPAYVDRKMFGHQDIFTSQLLARGRCAACARKGRR